MANLPLNNIVFRCYAHRQGSGPWYSVCLDLNLAVEAETLQAVKEKMNDVIGSYIEAVMDTDNPDSIQDLLPRRAPWLDWLKYYWIKQKIRFQNTLPRPSNDHTFKCFAPVKFAPAR